MAKKARKKGEDEAPAFEFPAFDEKEFLTHEFEQFYATVLAFGFGVLIGIVADLLASAVRSSWAGLGIGLLGVIGGAMAIRSLRPASSQYTRGDWAALVVLMFFAFLGVWFLVADLGRAISG